MSEPVIRKPFIPKDDLGHPIAGWEELLDRANEAEAKVAELEQKLAAMTEDRDLWQSDHDDDCPYKDQVENLKQVTSALQKIMDLIGQGVLVRDVSRDSEPGWAFSAMWLVVALKDAHLALNGQKV